ncbi:MAG: GvpL/GvpF family gas vesicle protein [Candidatus Theseobacter exili]|nr:GvpL/GvpF family gas vesicle protein [Candidatus Theseobacter exili]
MDLIYLYYVTRTKPNRSNLEDIGAEICPIYFQDTYAVVSKVSKDEFSEDNLKKNLANMEWVEKRIRLHERIIEEIMEKTTVLPFKFGTIFESGENVEKLLKEHNEEYKKIIANLEGKEEWGIKIYCDIEKLKGSLTLENDEISKIDKEISSSSPGKAHLLKKKKNELIKNVINEVISGYTQDSFEQFIKISLETKINKILPKEVTERKDSMVLNAAFLINKERVKECGGILGYLKTKYASKGFVFDWTGPWPPYNFCDLPKEQV